MYNLIYIYKYKCTYIDISVYIKPVHTLRIKYVKQINEYWSLFFSVLLSFQPWSNSIPFYKTIFDEIAHVNAYEVRKYRSVVSHSGNIDGNRGEFLIRASHRIAKRSIIRLVERIKKRKKNTRPGTLCTRDSTCSRSSDATSRKARNVICYLLIINT